MRNLILALFIAVLGGTLGFFAARQPGQTTHETLIAGTKADTSSAVPRQTQPRVIRQRFDWSQIESEDVEQLIANLRAIGCPEQTIADIVHARIFALYQAKVNLIFDPLARYWNTSAEAKLVDEQVKEIRVGRDKVLAGLNLRDSDFDKSSAISPEKQSRVSEAFRTFPKIETTSDTPPEEWTKAMDARKARVNYLSQYLTPDELLTYRITQDGNANLIAGLLRGINPTDEEFRNVFAALDSDAQSLIRTNGFLSPELEAKLKGALGDQRYTEYRSDQDEGNANLRGWAEAAGLSDEQSRQLSELRATADKMSNEEYARAVQNILKNPALTQRFFANPNFSQSVPKVK